MAVGATDAHLALRNGPEPFAGPKRGATPLMVPVSVQAAGLKRDFQSPAPESSIAPAPLVQITGPQPPAGKQSARVPLRNSDLTSAMKADGCQRLWQPATSPAPRPMEAVRCIRLGELRGLVPIPYVALQDTRHGHPGCNPFRPPFDAARRRLGSSGGAGSRPTECSCDGPRPP
jgi:hypothetical protein